MIRENSKRGLLAGAFAASALLAAAPFVVTASTGTDYCLIGARSLAEVVTRGGEPPPRARPAPRLLEADGPDARSDDWKIRLALTPFPFVDAVHTSLELVPANTIGPSRMAPEFFQVHGVIRKASDDSPASIRPCDAGSLVRQFTGGHVLQGIVVQRDLNRVLLGRDPVTYVDLMSGNRTEMMATLSALRLAVDDFNRNRLTYGFIREPNSNTLIFTLLEQLGVGPGRGVLAPVRDGSVPWWAPGFRRVPHLIPASARENAPAPDPVPGT